MPSEDWERFQALTRELAADAPTRARAYGRTLSQLIHALSPPAPLHWMDWEQRKAMRLLFPGS